MTALLPLMNTKQQSVSLGRLPIWRLRESHQESTNPPVLLGLIRKIALWLAGWRYDVKALGLENFPLKGGVLMVCNHVSYVDTVVLSLACPRPIRFLSYEGLFGVPLLGTILRMAGAIPVSPTRATEAIRRAAECVKRGEVVCIFPEGQLTRTGCLMELKSGFELIARQADCQVVVAQLDGLWGSIHSFEGGRYFTKWPKGLRRAAAVSFSTPLRATEATSERVREILLDLGENAFRERLLTSSLPQRLVGALKARALRTVIVDPSSPIKRLRGAELLTGAWLLAKTWKQLPGRRIGILLPPGIAGTLANVGVLFSGKIPVNLNPTLTVEAADSCLQLGGIKTVITAEILVKKFPTFPWPEDVILIERALKQPSHMEGLLSGAACLLLPVGVLKHLMRIPALGQEDEALLLFTSGTSGLPKGVALTHRQVLSNFDQVSETGFLQQDDRILSALPLFHSFGLTMGLFMPLLSGRKLVTAPSPLDCEKVSVAARDGKVTVLLTTPTFLRNYAKRIPCDAFSTLRLAATGAERLPAETAELFRSRFGCEVCEGYGLTEASPVVSFNMPHPVRGLGAQSDQSGSMAGSAGRLLPGMTMRLLDPETGKESPGLSCGILALHGPNIINEYLNDQCPEKFENGWLITGDIVRLDAEGFLFLEGRLSRFSKIGGEMVSHAAVEEAIGKAFPDASVQDCVLGRPSGDKGEELVLLTTRKITREDLRRELEVPNLWIPRHVLCVESIPTLATGKLDLAASRRLIEDQIATA